MSFNRFRSAHSKPAYERDAHSTRALPLYKQYSSSSTRTPTLEEDIIPLTNTRSMSVSRNNSFTMKTLDPRRLSMRLKRSSGSPSPASSPSTSPAPYDQYTTHRSNTDPLPLPSCASSGSRAEFVYKPIHRKDYTAVVAETATVQARSPVLASGSRYHYNHLPSGPACRKHMGLGIEERTIASQAQAQRQTQSRSRSRSRAAVHPRARAQAHYAYDEDEINDSHDLYDDLDEGYGAARRERSRPADLYTSAAEKRHRAARRLTTVMVPDAEDIYG
ncbi:uncharacterized protein DSM5745_04946 [Aspergillus mulundensis]|uniref:Uncharacterized protein n=1 Tax=Aspergillus mulundensis TaxID=1810919 RepID=A0A3D8S525_9EURO|nr:hypothetical protein DSM5745_04946 [Aspergillus mulundensis]RDW81389.1 hypothetical protein DSM5745_04946 [Aspergillus mulundensis]